MAVELSWARPGHLHRVRVRLIDALASRLYHPLGVRVCFYQLVHRVARCDDYDCWWTVCGLSYGRAGDALEEADALTCITCAAGFR